MKKKKQFKVKCPDCDKEIVGFSGHHAKQNLMIHQKTSMKCKEFKELLRRRAKIKDFRRPENLRFS